jgi:hypothetical protein
LVGFFAVEFWNFFCCCCTGWGYIVACTKVLTTYHTWISPSTILLHSPSSLKVLYVL